MASMTSSRFRSVALLVLVALLFACTSSDDSGDSGDDADAGGSTTAPGGDGDDDETGYVGRIDALDAFVAIVASPTGTIAYVCDQGTFSEWFRTDEVLGDDPLLLTNARGTQLQVTKDGDAANGDLLLADGTFHEVETTLAHGEPVLYRAMGANETDVMLGGWIVSGDEQRGALEANPATDRRDVRAAPTINLSVAITLPVPSTTTSSTSSTTRPPISIPPSSKPGNPVQVTLPPPITLDLLAFPITPPSLGSATPNSVLDNEFVFAAMGDSFGSGEGNPVVAGDYNANGELIEDGDPEKWNRTDLPDGIESVGNLRCHRSDESGAAKAARTLNQAFPDVDFHFNSFACSGAEVQHLYDESYAGAEPDLMENALIDPQIDQATEWLDGAGLDRVDALFMSIGGNNSGFGDVVGTCIDFLAALVASCDDGDLMQQVVNPGMASLNEQVEELGSPPGGWYSGLSDAIDAALPEAEVYLSSSPDPLSSDTGGVEICSDNEGRMNGDLTSGLTEEEAIFARDTVLVLLNDAMQLGATNHGWHFLDELHARSVGQGLCGVTAIVNTNNTALRTQGRDDDIGAPGVVNVSRGIVHPNNRGFTLYGDVISDAVRQQIAGRFTTVPPARLRQISATRNGPIELAWDDQSTNELSYRLTATPISGGTPETFELGPNTVRFVHNVNRAQTSNYSLVACGAVGCSAPATTMATNVPPAASVRNLAVASQFSSVSDIAVRLTWVNAAETATYWVIEAKNASGAVVGVATRSNSATGGTIRLPPNLDVTITVRACNIVGGGTCGSASPGVTVRTFNTTRPVTTTRSRPTTSRVPTTLAR